jgi:hypothetical protein
MTNLPTIEQYLRSDRITRGIIRKLYKDAGIHPPHAGFGRAHALKNKHYPPDHAQHEPRPYRYHFRDDTLREQHFAYNKMKSQAVFRKEEWELTLEDFFALWHDHWRDRGRSIHNVVLARIDADRPWHKDNAEIIPRWEHIQRVAALRRGQPRTCR